jgi:hypothetical protein
MTRLPEQWLATRKSAAQAYFQPELSSSPAHAASLAAPRRIFISLRSVGNQSRFANALAGALLGCGGGSRQQVKNSLPPQQFQSTYTIYVSTFSSSLVATHSTIHRFTFDPASSGLREVDASAVVPVGLTWLTVHFTALV